MNERFQSWSLHRLSSISDKFFLFPYIKCYILYWSRSSPKLSKRTENQQLASLGHVRKLYCLNLHQYNNTSLDLIPSITLVYLDSSFFFSNTQFISFLLSSLFLSSLETHGHFSQVSNSSSWKDAVKNWMFQYCLRTFRDVKNISLRYLELWNITRQNLKSHQWNVCYARQCFSVSVCVSLLFKSTKDISWEGTNL